MRQARPEQAAPNWQVWAALLVVYIVWGSTYLGIRVVVETMPPLFSAAARHVLAGTILFAFLALRHGRGSLRLSREEWKAAGFVGLALLLGGNGLVMLGERDVPSGLAALIVAVVPLFVVLLRFTFGERVVLGTIIGVTIGLVGMMVLIVPRGIDGSVSLIGMLMLVAASASWAIGSYFSKRVALPRDPLASTGAQMLTGGLALAVVALLTGEIGLVQPERFSAGSLIAFAYLVSFGSVLAYTAYTWLLVHAPVSKVSTYAFVNPVVATFLGALYGESIDSLMLIGAAMIVVAVALVIFNESRPSASKGALEAEPSPATTNAG
ncbi:MAG: EamA family transporter [Candidatus Limnocylindrales bacterium]